MKKNENFLVTIFILLIFIISGCEDPNDPVPDPIKILSGNAFATPDSVISGGYATITYYSTNAIVVTCNNDTLESTNGYFQVENLTSDRFYVFVFYGNKNQVLTKVVTVNVQVMTLKDTMTNYLCSSPYKATKREDEYVAGIWEEQSMTPLESRQLWLFDKNGTSRVWDPTNGETITNHVWYFTDDLKNLFYGGQTEEIIVLNQTTLILRYWVYSYNPQTGEYDIKAFRGQKTYTHQ